MGDDSPLSSPALSPRRAPAPPPPPPPPHPVRLEPARALRGDTRGAAALRRQRLPAAPDRAPEGFWPSQGGGSFQVGGARGAGSRLGGASEDGEASGASGSRRSILV